MRIMAIKLAVAVVFHGSAALAQDADRGEKLAARWCAGCHTIGTPAAKARRATPFEQIAEKPGVSSKVIADFLMLPHSTMPDLPIRRSEAEDIAAFIMQMKK